MPECQSFFLTFFYPGPIFMFFVAWFTPELLAYFSPESLAWFAPKSSENDSQYPSTGTGTQNE